MVQSLQNGIQVPFKYQVSVKVKWFASTQWRHR